MTSTPVDPADVTGWQCWCCGSTGDPEAMVRLGNHPEVTLCLRCARWTAKRAAELEDRDRTGLLVLGRDQLRAARRTVLERGWHDHRVLGGALRWLGRRLP